MCQIRANGVLLLGLLTPGGAKGRIGGMTWDQLLEQPEDELYGSEGRRVRAGVVPLLARLTPLPAHNVTITATGQTDEGRVPRHYEQALRVDVPGPRRVGWQACIS